MASGGVIFTTIQKFLPDSQGERYPLLSDRRNIIVMADEAHRSQYGLRGKLVISIAAGVRLEKLCGYLPKSAVIRAMPNTPALIGEGMAGLARGKGTSDEQMALALALFAAVGKSQEVDEAHMDIVTALAGSGPAFVFVMIDALADGAVRLGLRRDAAVAMAAQMVQGAARMVVQTGTHPAALKDQVTTPGGCTAAGLSVMEDGKIRSVLARTIEETARVAGKLG